MSAATGISVKFCKVAELELHMSASGRAGIWYRLVSLFYLRLLLHDSQ